MWPWFNNNPLMSRVMRESASPHAKKNSLASEGDEVIIEDAQSKIDQHDHLDQDEETSKDVATDEDENNVTSNSSDGQRSPPPSLVSFGPHNAAGGQSLIASAAASNMMYHMSPYMNPYLQVII